MPKLNKTTFSEKIFAFQFSACYLGYKEEPFICKVVLKYPWTWVVHIVLLGLELSKEMVSTVES